MGKQTSGDFCQFNVYLVTFTSVHSVHSCLSVLTCMFFLTSSGDELLPSTEWRLPSPSAGAHGRVHTHEDAQEDTGTLVVRVLRDLRQDGATHLHRKFPHARFCSTLRRH